MNTITKIQSSKDLTPHLGVLTKTLSRAFYNDPYYEYIMPNAQKREAQIQWWGRILLKYTLKNGSIYISNDHKGVALWVGPDKPFLDDLQLALMGLVLFPFKVGIKNFLRLLHINGQWDKAHKKQNKRHYYLMVIGVDPDLQNQGIGSRLMADVLNRADSEKLDCYLETVTAQNVNFYKKHDFEIIDNNKLVNDSQYWIMRRTFRTV